MKVFYDLLSFIVSICIFPFEFLKRDPAVRHRWARQKWGIGSHGPHDIWIHAVSVGEVLAASSLVNEVNHRRPDIKIALSTVTDTGQIVAKNNMQDTTVFYLPWDIRHVAYRVMDDIKPRLIVIMETELWPALIWSADYRNIPLVILNGRISDASYSGYRKIRWFMKRLLSKVSFIGMQGQTDLERIRNIGAPEKISAVTGNLKYDVEPPASSTLSNEPSTNLFWLNILKRPVWIAGSTHEGEEEKILDAYRQIISRGTNLTLILAPRHPERFQAVEKLIKQAGFSCLRRTDINAGSSNTGSLPASKVLLLDAMGELATAYSAADVVFMGGSLSPAGGHNILEPALWKKPILFGPHMENFRQMAELFIQEDACIQVATPEDLTSAVTTLLADPEKAAAMAGRAHNILRRNRGASIRCSDIIESYIENRH